MKDEDYHNRLLLDMMDLAAFDFLIGKYVIKSLSYSKIK
jgi:hypothetical protein